MVGLSAKYKHLLGFLSSLLIALLSITQAINVLSSGESQVLYTIASDFLGTIVFRLEPLNALFLVLVNFLSVGVMFFAKDVLTQIRRPLLSLHLLTLLTIQIAMTVLCLVESFPVFISAWEVMSIGSLLLILYNNAERATFKAGLNYLIQMHLGVLFLTFAALEVQRVTGAMHFSALADYFSQKDNFPLFILFLVGFGFKAGIVPLHTWMRPLYQKAPAHVAALLSGCTLNIALLGILKVLSYTQTNHLAMGLTLLGLSVFSALYGIIQASQQKHLLSSLAFSSIENVGIIGIGLSVGVLGLSVGNPLMAHISFIGAVLQIINHAVVKSLLFFNTGKLIEQTGTDNLDVLGGLIKKMPHTAFLFLCGALAISGIPPLGGFVSEFMIFSGLFIDIEKTNLYLTMAGLVGLLGLSITGGLSIFTFVRNFGITFLGNPRTPFRGLIKEAGLADRLFMGLLLVLLLVTGMLAEYIVPIVGNTLGKLAGSDAASYDLPGGLHSFEMGSLLLVGVFILLFWLRANLLKKAEQRVHVTWGCGYTAATPKIQYTGTSFSESVAELSRPFFQKQKPLPLAVTDLFPADIPFQVERTDYLEAPHWFKPFRFITLSFKRFANLQRGKIQHYILYGFVFILVLLALTFLNLI